MPVIGPDMQYSADKANTFYHYFSIVILMYCINYKNLCWTIQIRNMYIYTAVTT